VIDIVTMTAQELSNWLKGREYPTYAASIIFDWIFKKNKVNFSDMSNLKYDLREALARNFRIAHAKLDETLTSKMDETKKYIFSLEDGQAIEAALITGAKRTACLSTQVGCRFGCRFCASGSAGFIRNLTEPEILSQFILINNVQPQEGAIENIVFMGIGEPLDNLETLKKTLLTLHAKEKWDVSMRRITVSTCGIPDKIEELARFSVHPELAISLHAPTDAIRNDLMPINKLYGVHKLMESCKAYTHKTKRIVTFEYMLLRGINDTKACLTALLALVRDFDCKVNLIPYNPTPQGEFSCSEEKTMRSFQEMLYTHGVKVTLRATKGSDVQAACGQLRLTRTASVPQEESSE
jgi:23S rRNA (adenine2503-C2)-methyltransferase